MNYLARLSGFSSQLMTLTGFFHGVLRVRQAGVSAKTNVVRYHILKCLERRGAHHLTEVSAFLNTKTNTLSELLDRMVRDGLVQRSFATDDRRVTLLRITPLGRAAIREFEKGLMDKLGHYLEGLAREDREDLVQAIESLARILERHDRASGRPFPF
jgi:DNA-binding MarR family transcriptional regulator